MNDFKTIPTSDLYFSAYASLRGIPPKLQKSHNRVIFIFPLTDAFNAVSNDFHNAEVNLAAYCGELRKLKALMFAERDNERNTLGS